MITIASDFRFMLSRWVRACARARTRRTPIAGCRTPADVRGMAALVGKAGLREPIRSRARRRGNYGGRALLPFIVAVSKMGAACASYFNSCARRQAHYGAPQTAPRQMLTAFIRRKAQPSPVPSARKPSNSSLCSSLQLIVTPQKLCVCFRSFPGNGFVATRPSPQRIVFFGPRVTITRYRASRNFKKHLELA